LAKLNFMKQENLTEVQTEAVSLRLSAGAVVPINSSNQLANVNDPALVQAVPDGNGGANVTITFNIGDVTVVAADEMFEEDLDKEGDKKVHFAFNNTSTGSIGIRSSSLAGMTVAQRAPGTSDRSVTINLEFVIDDGKVGGAG
jgi:hypothetical protein